MKLRPSPQWCLILAFTGILFTVPLFQTVLELSHGERPQALDVFRRRPTSANLRAYERDLEDASAVAKWARPPLQYAQFAWLKDGGSKVLLGRDGWLFFRPGVQCITERPGIQKSASTAAEALSAILAFRNQLADRGIQLLIVPAPNKESIYPEKLTERTVPTTPLSADTQALLRGLKAAGAEFLDLFELFSRAKADSAGPGANTLYLAQDSHWSPAGVDVAAKAVAHRLLERGWVRLGNRDYGTRTASIARAGDVLRMMLVPQLERHFRPERVSCQQVITSGDTQTYRDDPDSEILILGDSFLRIFETDEPGAAGFVAHLAAELKQPVASLVNDGGASTLVRQELYRRPALLAHKKVVIWEFVERDIRLGTEGWQLVPVPKNE